MRITIENPKEATIKRLTEEGEPFVIKNNILYVNRLPRAVTALKVNDKHYPDMKGTKND